MAAAFAGNDELWRECATWLTKFELLRSDHRANLDTAAISDLANTLRDGVLLCNLLNKLDPGCIDFKAFSQKPAMAQFLCLRNINLFLKTCQTSFGLKDSDLFEPSMLFDLTNFHQVLVCLSKISMSPKALRHNINGFSAHVEKTEEEEEIYQGLKSVKPNPDIYVRINYYDAFNQQSEDIYQDLCVLAPAISAQPPLEKRDYVINELVNTEKNYVDVLNKIKKFYIKPLQSVMDPEHHKMIFLNILEILEVHKELRNQLLKMQTDKTVKLSNIIISFRDRLLIYGHFCSNLTDAANTLQELCDKNETLKCLIQKYDKEANNGKFKLSDLLQIPMQRILKYHLILDKLVDATDPNHEEYKELKRARETMLDVASYINEMARDKDHIDVLNELAKNMVWDTNCQFPIERCGRLRKDAEIKVKMHGETKPKTRYAFIFDKFIILTKQNRPNQFLYRSKLDLAEFRVDEAHNRALLNQGIRWAYQWHMVKTDKKVVYSMSVRSIEIKEAMIKAIKEAIDNVRPASLHATTHKFEMHTFATPIRCNRCSKYLKGQIFQGYDCRTCHIAVHKECISSSGKCGSPPPGPLPSLPSPEVSSLQTKLWFAGEKDRTEASSLLENRKTGTFLVRIRLQNEPDRYALSLKTENGVKHMKICTNNMDGNEQKYYLSISRFFKSLEEMVSNYQQVSLKENFERLEENAKLEYPYRQIKAQATKQYSSPNLSFNVGDTVVIIEKDEYKEGWSKGITKDGQMGYFPSSYVQEKEEITYDAF